MKIFSMMKSIFSFIGKLPIKLMDNFESPVEYGKLQNILINDIFITTNVLQLH